MDKTTQLEEDDGAVDSDPEGDEDVQEKAETGSRHSEKDESHNSEKDEPETGSQNSEKDEPLATIEGAEPTDDTKPEEEAPKTDSDVATSSKVPETDDASASEKAVDTSSEPPIPQLEPAASVAETEQTSTADNQNEVPFEKTPEDTQTVAVSNV